MRSLYDGPYEIVFTDTPARCLSQRAREKEVSGTLEMTPYRTFVDWQESMRVGFDHGYARVDLPAPFDAQTGGTVEVRHKESGV